LAPTSWDSFRRAAWRTTAVSLRWIAYRLFLTIRYRHPISSL